MHLVNLHSGGHWLRHVWVHVGHWVLFVTVFDGALGDMRLQSLAKVQRANDCIDDGYNDKQNRDDGKGCERTAGRHIIIHTRLVGVHANELEKEVGEGSQEDDDNSGHEDPVLSSGGPYGCQQKQDGEWNNDNRQLELNVVGLQHDNQELNGEAQEEEKVKLEQSDENLKGKIATFHAKIGRDVLVNGPGEFIVKLPANYRQQDSTECEYAWNCNKKRFDSFPDSFLVHQSACALGLEVLVRFLDLILLNGGIDEQSDVEETESDNLNGVFQAKGIIDHEEHKQMAKDEESEVCRDCSLLWILKVVVYAVRYSVIPIDQVVLELCEYISFKGQNY